MEPDNQAATFYRSPYPAHLAGDARKSSMFACFVPTSRGCGPRKASSDILFRRCTRWVRSHPRRLWPFTQRDPKVTQGGPGRSSSGQATTLIPRGQTVPLRGSVCGCVGGRPHGGGPAPSRSRLRRGQGHTQTSEAQAASHTVLWSNDYLLTHRPHCKQTQKQLYSICGRGTKAPCHERALIMSSLYGENDGFHHLTY